MGAMGAAVTGTALALLLAGAGWCEVGKLGRGQAALFSGAGLLGVGIPLMAFGFGS